MSNNLLLKEEGGCWGAASWSSNHGDWRSKLHQLTRWSRAIISSKKRKKTEGGSWGGASWSSSHGARRSKLHQLPRWSRFAASAHRVGLTSHYSNSLRWPIAVCACLWLCQWLSDSVTQLLTECVPLCPMWRELCALCMWCDVWGCEFYVWDLKLAIWFRTLNFSFLIQFFFC